MVQGQLLAAQPAPWRGGHGAEFVDEIERSSNDGEPPT
jgi:hypothetical protein